MRSAGITLALAMLSVDPIPVTTLLSTPAIIAAGQLATQTVAQLPASLE